MLPINDNQRGGTPLSSNCIVWQGKDLPCIKLCKGDTVSAVVYKIATELCEIMDLLDISNYDMSCFGLGKCGPEDYKELIQLLIDKVCELEGVDTSSTASSNEGIDTYVEVADIFIVKDASGDDVTKRTIKDYVELIGKRVSNDVNSIAKLQSDVQDLTNRVTELEESANSGESSISVSSCLLGETSISINDAYESLDCDYSKEKDAVGDVDLIKKNINKVNMSIQKLLTSTGSFQNMSEWKNNVTTISEAIGNMWLVVSEMYTALSNQVEAYPIVTAVYFNTAIKKYDSNLEEQIALFTFRIVNPSGLGVKSAKLVFSNTISGTTISDYIIIQEPNAYTTDSFEVTNSDLQNIDLATQDTLKVVIDIVFEDGTEVTDTTELSTSETFPESTEAVESKATYSSIVIRVTNAKYAGLVFLYNESGEQYSTQSFNQESGIQELIFDNLESGNYYYDVYVEGIHSNKTKVSTLIYTTSVDALSDGSYIEDYDESESYISPDTMLEYLNSLNS